MSIENRRRLEKTRKKLLLLEERCRILESGPRSNESGAAREVTARSLKKMIHQMKEEMTRFESRVSIGSEQA